MSHALACLASEEPAHRWREPSRSDASRRPSEKSNSAARPVIVTTQDNRELLCESELEAKAAFILMARPDCVRLYEQPEPVRYCDYEGVERHHTFDLLVVLRSGNRIAVAVKPARVAEKLGLPALLRHIASQIDPAFASGVLLMTDAKMPRNAVANGRLVHDARRHPDPEIDQRVRDVIETLNGTTTIVSIVRAAGLDGHDQGFYAVARAIGDGLIVPAAPGLIDHETPVSPVSNRGPR